MSIYNKIDLKLKSTQQMVSSDIPTSTYCRLIADRKFALKLIKHSLRGHQGASHQSIGYVHDSDRSIIRIYKSRITFFSLMRAISLLYA